MVNFKTEIGHFVQSCGSVTSQFVARKLQKTPKEKSFGGELFALFKGTKKIGKKQSFGGKIVLGKKGCVFERCLVLSQKYTKSFGGKNLALCKCFVPSKV